MLERHRLAEDCLLKADALYKERKYREAFIEYGKAFLLDTSLNHNKINNFSELLDNTSKNTLFEYLCSIPGKNSLPYLAMAKDKNTLLGQRIWKQEGNFPCTLFSGTLARIKSRENKIQFLIEQGIAKCKLRLMVIARSDRCSKFFNFPTDLIKEIIKQSPALYVLVKNDIENIIKNPVTHVSQSR